MGEPSIRVAALDDLAAIDAIYNHYVRTATCTWQYEPLPAEERRAWFDAHGDKHPIIVAVDGSDVLGYAALSVYNKRDGYRFTVENAVYVHPEHHRRGIGRALLGDLIVRARSLGHRNIIAGVSGDQEASLALHRAHGFVEVGRMKEIGVKFGKWLDVVYLQKVL